MFPSDARARLLPVPPAGGKTILDFYTDSATRSLFRRHIATILNR
jgi:hypothetical protein